MSSALPTRDAIVATAGETIARGSKSFAAASRLFDRETRERAWLLYAWCRACDDLADGQELGFASEAVDDPAARLETIRTRTQAALDGKWVGDPAFDALRIVAAETAMPHRLIWDLVEGFALDAAGWRPQSIEDLLRYCYHVAGAVGCMMAVVMGVRPDEDAVLDRACDLGIAFQLANVSRDVAEDAAIGRCYLPADWLAEADGDPLAVAHRLAALAERYEASARGGTPALSLRSAWAVLAAAGIYGDIARKVARGDTLEKRVTTSGSEKLGWIFRAYGQAARRRELYARTERPSDLWTRPR
ncbi:phytoene/squalene synthase family protein [Sphingomonas sp. MMS12-HWE2-04]|uniref:phytoene/squalene synthase family protein n=1 Tax=Sphingomonas sp. MMS12-HWE2-04 TaxID=3234199 RepID=UPI00384E0560